VRFRRDRCVLVFHLEHNVGNGVFGNRVGNAVR
jgi:hypothetical protein